MEELGKELGDGLYKKICDLIERGFKRVEDNMGAYEHNNTVLAGGGVGSYAITLNGSNQYVGVSDPFAQPAALTAMAWVYPVGFTATKGVVTYGTGAADRSWQLNCNSTGVVQANFYADGTTPVTASVAGAIGTNEWSLIAVTWNGSNIVCTKCTGGVVTSGGSVAFAGPIWNSAGNLVVGAIDTANVWNGRIQNAALWSRALSVADITAIYNSGRGLRYEGSPTPRRPE